MGFGLEYLHVIMHNVYCIMYNVYVHVITTEHVTCNKDIVK